MKYLFSLALIAVTLSVVGHAAPTDSTMTPGIGKAVHNDGNKPMTPEKSESIPKDTKPKTPEKNDKSTSEGDISDAFSVTAPQATISDRDTHSSNEASSSTSIAADKKDQNSHVADKPPPEKQVSNTDTSKGANQAQAAMAPSYVSTKVETKSAQIPAPTISAETQKLIDAAVKNAVQNTQKAADQNMKKVVDSAASETAKRTTEEIKKQSKNGDLKLKTIREPAPMGQTVVIPASTADNNFGGAIALPAGGLQQVPGAKQPKFKIVPVNDDQVDTLSPMSSDIITTTV